MSGSTSSPRCQPGTGSLPELDAPRHVVRIAQLAVGVFVLAADQLSKSIVLATHSAMSQPGSGWISVRLVRNHGASTGLGASHPLIVTGVEMLGIGLFAVLAVRTHNRVVAISLAALLGGALGNLADRFVRAPGRGGGAVVDWIHLAGRGGSLDLADVAIQFGAIIALIAWVVASRSSGASSGATERSTESSPTRPR